MCAQCLHHPYVIFLWGLGFKKQNTLSNLKWICSHFLKECFFFFFNFVSFTRPIFPLMCQKSWRLWTLHSLTLCENVRRVIKHKGEDAKENFLFSLIGDVGTGTWLCCKFPLRDYQKTLKRNDVRDLGPSS